MLFAFFAFVVFNACILTFTTSIGFVVAVAHATETPDIHTFGTSACSTITKSLFNHPFKVSRVRSHIGFWSKRARKNREEKVFRVYNPNKRSLAEGGKKEEKSASQNHI
jgi:hypothetical protein